MNYYEFITGPGLVLIKQRVYDVTIRQWLNPDWESLQESITDPSELFVYRFHKNNPIESTPQITYSKASNLNTWASLYGYDMDTMMNTTHRPPLPKQRDTFLNQALASGLDEAMQRAVHGLRKISFVPIPQAKEKLVLNPTFAGSSSGFGNGFLLTSMASNGLTYANVIDGAPGVVQNIFLSVLNGSKFLHETSHIKSAKKSVYFFAKKTGTSSDIAEALMASDMDNVNR